MRRWTLLVSLSLSFSDSSYRVRKSNHQGWTRERSNVSRAGHNPLVNAASLHIGVHQRQVLGAPAIKQTSRVALTNAKRKVEEVEEKEEEEEEEREYICTSACAYLRFGE